jgi:hypothetical protein
MSAGVTAMPDLGQQRTLSSRPGSGIVKRDRPPRKLSPIEFRYGRYRMDKAAEKRCRKNAKRLRDWHASLAHGIPNRWTAWPHPWEASHGE